MKNAIKASEEVLMVSLSGYPVLTGLYRAHGVECQLSGYPVLTGPRFLAFEIPCPVRFQVGLRGFLLKPSRLIAMPNLIMFMVEFIGGSQRLTYLGF